MACVDLSKYNNKNYQPGGILKRALWYVVNAAVFKSSVPWLQSLKRTLLRCFGASVGRRVVIKPCVNIKYPWFFKIGELVWIGEGVWIDNLCKVQIGNNACLSQGVYLTTGNHDYKKETFDLMLKPLVIEDGVWVGAKALICPGVILRSHSVVTAGSVVTKSTEPFMVYRGNPAVIARKRDITAPGAENKR